MTHVSLCGHLLMQAQKKRPASLRQLKAETWPALCRCWSSLTILMLLFLKMVCQPFATNGPVEVVRCLLQAAADKDKCTNRGCTPMHVAGHRGHVEGVRCSLEASADNDKYNKNGDTPMHVACQQNHVEVVRCLLEASADKNMDTNIGFTVHVASHTGHVDVGRLLLEAGADEDKCDDNGGTPIHVACQKGPVEVVRCLLEASADKNMDTHICFTPVHVASHTVHVDVGRLLLEAGADKDKCDDNGGTPMHVACQKGHVEVVRCLLEGQQNHVDVARCLLHAGADKDKCDDTGGTPKGHVLCVACWKLVPTRTSVTTPASRPCILLVNIIMWKLCCSLTPTRTMTPMMALRPRMLLVKISMWKLRVCWWSLVATRITNLFNAGLTPMQGYVIVVRCLFQAGGKDDGATAPYSGLECPGEHSAVLTHIASLDKMIDTQKWFSFGFRFQQIPPKSSPKNPPPPPTPPSPKRDTRLGMCSSQVFGHKTLLLKNLTPNPSNPSNLRHIGRPSPRRRSSLPRGAASTTSRPGGWAEPRHSWHPATKENPAGRFFLFFNTKNSFYVLEKQEGIPSKPSDREPCEPGGLEQECSLRRGVNPEF